MLCVVVVVVLVLVLVLVVVLVVRALVFQGLHRNANLKRYTRMYIPWTVYAKIDLAYCFSELDAKIQPVAISAASPHLCLFVTNENDTIADISRVLGLNAKVVTKLNQPIHEHLTPTVRSTIAGSEPCLAYSFHFLLCSD